MLQRDLDIIDHSYYQDYFADKVVLITGGGGSLGMKMIEKLINMRVKRVVSIDRSPHSVYNIKNVFNDSRVEARLVDIVDFVSLDDVFDQSLPDLVIHCAADKLVEQSEDKFKHMYTTNVQGTINVANCVLNVQQMHHKRCDLVNVSSFMVDVTNNVVALTKKLGERVVDMYSDANERVANSFMINVRIGNIVDSSDNVVQSMFETFNTGKMFELYHSIDKHLFCTREEVISDIFALVNTIDRKRCEGELTLLTEYGDRVDWLTGTYIPCIMLGSRVQPISVLNLYTNTCKMMYSNPDYYSTRNDTERKYKYDSFDQINDLYGEWINAPVISYSVREDVVGDEEDGVHRKYKLPRNNTNLTKNFCNAMSKALSINDKRALHIGLTVLKDML